MLRGLLSQTALKGARGLIAPRINSLRRLGSRLHELEVRPRGIQAFEQRFKPRGCAELVDAWPQLHVLPNTAAAVDGDEHLDSIEQIGRLPNTALQQVFIACSPRHPNRIRKVTNSRNKSFIHNILCG